MASLPSRSRSHSSSVPEAPGSRQAMPITAIDRASTSGLVIRPLLRCFADPCRCTTRGPRRPRRHRGRAVADGSELPAPCRERPLRPGTTRTAHLVERTLASRCQGSGPAQASSLSGILTDRHVRRPGAAGTAPGPWLGARSVMLSVRGERGVAPRGAAGGEHRERRGRLGGAAAADGSATAARTALAPLCRTPPRALDQASCAAHMPSPRTSPPHEYPPHDCHM